MNRTQYDELIAMDRADPKPLKAAYFPGPDRTLLLGYTVERSTYHVFTQDHLIHLQVTDSAPGIATGDRTTQLHVASAEFPDPSMLIPSKRVFPERSDFLFCAWLKDNGYYVPFTRHEPARLVFSEERFRPFLFHVTEDAPVLDTSALRRFE